MMGACGWHAVTERARSEQVLGDRRWTPSALSLVIETATSRSHCVRAGADWSDVAAGGERRAMASCALCVKRGLPARLICARAGCRRA
jgi:hypothetical protein